MRLAALAEFLDRLSRGDTVAWCIVSVFFLLFGLAMLVALYFHRKNKKEDEAWKNRWYRKK